MKLETERLILRKPRMSDIDDLVEGLNNLNVSKMMVPIACPYKEKDAKEFLLKIIKKRYNLNQESYLFFLELKSNKKVIGSIGVHKIDRFSGTGWTGSWINEEYWKNGYMTEAKIVLNEFVFNKLKLRKILSPVFTNNQASNMTQRRIGYKLEGILKKNEKSLATNEIHDINLYALFKEDWKKNLPKLKKHLKEKIKRLEKEGKKK